MVPFFATIDIAEMHRIRRLVTPANMKVDGAARGKKRLVCVCVCACVRVCVRACAYVCVCLRASVCVRA